MKTISEVLKGRIEKTVEEKKAEAYLTPNITPILQNGPQCGMVALKMALDSVLDRDEGQSLQRILETAQRLGISRSGEMFSVEWMEKLAQELVRDVKVENIAFPTTAQQLCNLLLSGALFLVPYDADKDHSPTQLKGHAAHWALLHGFLNLLPPGDETGLDWLTTTSALRPFVRCFLFAYQGKSRHSGVWDFHQLEASNANLEEIGPNRLNDPLNYVFPPQGLDLKQRVLMISR